MSSSTPRIDALLSGRSPGTLPSDLSPVPRTGVAIVTCMDARIDPYREFGLEPGDAHVIRTAGATVTDDVLRSLVASQWALGTSEVLVLGHSGCGMAVLDEDDLWQRIHGGGSGIPPFPMRSFTDVAENVREGVAAVRGSWFLRPDTGVRGFVYRLETGELESVE